jgi:hypothetical protein
MKEKIARVKKKIPEQTSRVMDSVAKVTAKIPEQTAKVRESVARVKEKIPEEAIRVKNSVARVTAKIPEQTVRVKNSFAKVTARIPEEALRVKNSVSNLTAKIPEQTIRVKNSVIEMQRRASRKAVSAILCIIGVAGLINYQNFIIIELGLLGAFCDLLYELYGTKKGWWSYDDSHSHYMIAGRVPLGIVFTYFCMGMVAVTFVLFRLSL